MEVRPHDLTHRTLARSHRGNGKQVWSRAMHGRQLRSKMAPSTKHAIHSVSTSSSAKGRQPARASWPNEVLTPNAAMATTKHARETSLRPVCTPCGTPQAGHRAAPRKAAGPRDHGFPGALQRHRTPQRGLSYRQRCVSLLSWPGPRSTKTIAHPPQALSTLPRWLRTNMRRRLCSDCCRPWPRRDLTVCVQQRP